MWLVVPVGDLRVVYYGSSLIGTYFPQPCPQAAPKVLPPPSTPPRRSRPGKALPRVGLRGGETERS
jgi:hypothetical protein